MKPTETDPTEVDSEKTKEETNHYAHLPRWEDMQKEKAAKINEERQNDRDPRTEKEKKERSYVDKRNQGEPIDVEDGYEVFAEMASGIRWAAYSMPMIDRLRIAKVMLFNHTGNREDDNFDPVVATATELVDDVIELLEDHPRQAKLGMNHFKPKTRYGV